MKAIVWMGVGSMVMILLAGLCAPFVLRSTKRPASTQALSNARQIGLALFDFESDYGRFPDAATAAAVKSATGTTWDLKDGTSNELFRQLIATGIVTSEEIFYAKVYGARKPDNVISNEAKTLARGECGFAYVALKSGALSGPSIRPLVVAPLIPGTLKFDPVPFEGKAVILRGDNRAVSMAIHPDGTVRDGGKDIFDPSQPYWKGLSPDVKWADLPARPLAPYTPANWWVGGAVGIVVMALVVAIVRGRWQLRKRSPMDAFRNA
ncbi:hypothetical protein [Luteolibacter sp. LG18]|uniref:hypothetical protein n=1 Tax=Luteolibacter sp. LG18 TaxID=2819286 RepID=UPI002B300AF7|nr:hypothetical protein llg_08510 [Luteolibacter sp. LG18]